MDSDFVLMSFVPEVIRNLVVFNASEEALSRSIPLSSLGLLFFLS